MNKLRVLRSSDPNAFETLKTLAKGAKGFERTGLTKVKTEVIAKLEEYEFIFTYNYNDYVLLNQRLKTLIDKI
jgi:hypothetical protein